MKNKELEPDDIVVHKYKPFMKYQILCVLDTGQSLCKRLSDNKNLTLDNNYLMSTAEARKERIAELLKKD